MPKTLRKDRTGTPPRLFRSEKGLFLWELMRNPGQVSSPVPSSRRLAREMASSVPPDAQVVAEFGPGTGRFTRALLQRGISARNLHVFEINPAFAARIRARFPSVNLHEGPAQDLARLGPPEVDAVVSGLPLLSMPEPVRDEIVAAAFAKLAPRGVFVQFTYGPASPVPAATLDRLGLSYVRSPRIWTNLPPATVYVYRRRSGDADQMVVKGEAGQHARRA